MTDATTRRASSFAEKRLVTTYHLEGTSVRSVSSTADRACGFLPSIGQRTTRSRKLVGCRNGTTGCVSLGWANHFRRRKLTTGPVETDRRRSSKAQGKALHGPRQARIPGIGGKVYEEIRVTRAHDFTRIGPPAPNGIGFAAPAERQRHMGHPGGSLPQRQNHVLLEYRVLSKARSRFAKRWTRSIVAESSR